MADDPNRDILPVKEGSCVDTVISAIDPRERHLVCKLDRYQLEDKYLRLLDEMSNLKKLSNCQEDKIKRLGTKLIRLAGSPRLCGLTLDIVNDRNRMAALELENTKLKEKITVMRNQLLSHTMSGRSSSRSRNRVRPSSSGIVTCRSENNRVRTPCCQCIVGAGDDDGMRNYFVKIEKLEAQKKDMTSRIIELEKELAYLTNNRKEKVAEHVEYIRVWRQMKQLNDKLMATQEKNTELTTEINDLKTTLQLMTKNNQEIAAVLSSLHTQDKNQDFTITVPSDVEQCKKCCEMYDKIMQLEKTVGNTREDWQSADKSVQTIVLSTSTREQDTMIISNNEDKILSQSLLNEWKTNQEANGTSVISREKILKLLDQAQINTPLDASRITPKKECTGKCILDVAQKHSEEISCQRDILSAMQENLQKRFAYLENSNITLDQILLILFDVMQEFLFTNVDGKSCLDHQVSAIEDPLIDVNNNLPTKTIRDINQHDFNTEATKDFESDRCTSCSLKSTAFYSKKCNFACKKKSASILASSSMKDIFDAISSPLAYRKSYRDISKDFCPEKMVKIKRLKSPRYTKCNLTCHLRKVKDPLSLQEKRKLPCTIECLNDSIMLPMCPMDPLLITDRQGLIEIHISRLQLSTSRNEKDAIIIEIVSMQFFDDSCVMQDDQIHLLYVEYSFLEKRGEDMETISMKKPKTSAQEMVFNYKKKFWINEITHPVQRQNLRAMLAEDISPNINFTVISEPLPEEREVKDCEEVGYATFDIKQYALGDERKYILLPIKDNQNREIGTLKISVSSMNAIQQCLPKLR
ncbi:PREDICTED: protein fantom-like [Atta colombica]|uniref:protein fantom-like n=1 Tax=Atta colombica TaxID=520822 RepID=UPI00084C8D3C|nr:PREDICTED: protein fantom-like [Atta colombica]